MNENQQPREHLLALLTEAVGKRTLKKLILSRPADKARLKTVGRLVEIGGRDALQLETFFRDGKALHENLPAIQAPERVAALLEAHGQLDLLTTGGSAVVMRSKKGALHISSGIQGGEALAAAPHDRPKTRLLTGSEPFLAGLGIADETGRINDRMRAKFRQISRFLELLDDVYSELPGEGKLLVYDLCCGKSYLTFAVWHYLTAIKGRTVEMHGVDLKPDVIDFCSGLAARLGCEGLDFTCGDVGRLPIEGRPALIVSLHACDTATDLVLAAAVRSRARVILSTPCCHHEMMRQLDSPALGFIRHSILKQKLCDAATDSLRALRLEAEGYETEALELVDPEETPKNVMLRAVYRRPDEAKRRALLAEYDRAALLLGCDPMLRRLLDADDGRPES